MSIALHIEPANGALAPVEYRWDTDTDILTATLRAGEPREGMSGSVELTGDDGAWVVLDVKAGTIRGVEIAVWPDVRRVPTLSPPSGAESAALIVPARNADQSVSLVQIDTRLVAEADQAERTIHFRLGAARPARTVRIAADVLVDLDERNRILGLWLLNVPPFPEGE